MNLEGNLEAFSLPDIFQLLSFTKKSGALHISRAGMQGVVYFTTGSVTGGSPDLSRQSLGRRLVGGGLVDDAALTSAAEAAAAAGGTGLVRWLHDNDAVDEGVLHEHVVEHATDAVFDLLRWQQGEFAFVVDEANPDDLGVSLVVEDLVTDARARLEVWDGLTRTVPSPDAVVSTRMTLGEPETKLSADEWSLLALIDGERTVSQLVAITGKGEFATVRALAALVDRGLVTVGTSSEEGVAALLRRQAALSALEGRPEPVVTRSKPAVELPSTSSAHEPAVVPDVVPARPEPLVARQPDFPESPAPAAPRRASASSGGGGGGHLTSGSTALAESVPGASSLIERDPSVNKSLLLRLIAGVRGL